MKASNVKREKFMGSVFLTVATSCFVLTQMKWAIVVVTGVVLVSLRLFGVIAWPWMWVILWAPLLLDVALLLLMVVLWVCMRFLLALFSRPAEDDEV